MAQGYRCQIQKSTAVRLMRSRQAPFFVGAIFQGWLWSGVLGGLAQAPKSPGPVVPGPAGPKPPSGLFFNRAASRPGRGLQAVAREKLVAGLANVQNRNFQTGGRGGGGGEGV